MMRLLGTFYCLLSLLLADAKHSSDVSATYQVKRPNVLFLIGLFQRNDPHNVQSAQTDPNILLLYSDSMHSERWDKAAILRTARGMNSESSPDLSTGDENPQPYNLIDMLLRPRRRLSPTHGNVPVPSMWLHPPPAIEAPQNQQARSEATDTIASTSNEKPESGEDDSETPPPSTIMAIPDLLLDLGYMLTQPLWVDKSKNRESHDFGMIAKAPFIICPLGFQRDLLGNCRPVFRSRRGFVISRIRLSLGKKKDKATDEPSGSIQWPEEDKDEAEQEAYWITTNTPPTTNI